MNLKMIRLIKPYLKKFLPNSIINFFAIYLNFFRNESFSQEGEDLILKRLFDLIKPNNKGFYIDIGAHHPVRFSNTYLFYRKNWKGVNIDAMPGSMKAFNTFRPRDINIEVPVSDKSEILTYYVFNEPAINGFDKNIAQNISSDESNNFFIKSQREIKTMTATEIFDQHVPFEQEIDFITIDVEGFDYKALKSIDLIKYKPKVILIEVLNNESQSFLNNDANDLLHANEYTLYARTVNTSIYIKNKIFAEIIKGT